MENQHSIGNTISKLRKEKGWTQAELAEKLQVSDKAVSKWEKDGGSPSIDFIPVLAKLFDVSIDYLMTGKEKEKEIITMSKIELCAKNDDPEMLGDFSAETTDETGTSLITYIKKYNSLKVLKTLFDRCSHPTHYWNIFGQQWGKNINPDEYLMLAKINCERKYIQEVTRYKTIYAISDIEKSGYMPVINYLIENYQKLPAEQKEYYFGKEEILKPNQAWIAAYPYFLQTAYSNNDKETFNELLAKIIATNLQKETGRYYDQHFDQWFERHIHISVLRQTVEAAYRHGDVVLGEQLNGMCKEPLSNYDKKSIAIDNDKTLSDKEKQLHKAIHDGIVCVDELLNLKDFKVIKETIKKYPIHPIEKISSLLNSKHSRELFEYAVDNNLNKLAEYVANGYKLYEEEIEKDNKYLINYHIDLEIMNRFWRNTPEIINKNYFYALNSQNWNIPQILEFIAQCKEKIISELSLRLDKEKTIADLTKDFFEKELEKGNIDIVIIKLCVRLEAILKSTYHYEGDFSEMLNRYCKEYGTIDDGWDTPTDAEFVKPLNKLRICRNGIVHSEKSTVKLSLEEIKWCIDYICKMN